METKAELNQLFILQQAIAEKSESVVAIRNSALNKVIPRICFILCALLFTTHCDARSATERRAFASSNACPSTNKLFGKCPGYVVDHIIPLCAGGADRPTNMQWQELAESKAKDNQERRQCRALKRLIRG